MLLFNVALHRNLKLGNLSALPCQIYISTVCLPWTLEPDPALRLCSFITSCHCKSSITVLSILRFSICHAFQPRVLLRYALPHARTHLFVCSLSAVVVVLCWENTKLHYLVFCSPAGRPKQSDFIQRWGETVRWVSMKWKSWADLAQFHLKKKFWGDECVHRVLEKQGNNVLRNQAREAFVFPDLGLWCRHIRGQSRCVVLKPELFCLLGWPELA